MVLSKIYAGKPIKYVSLTNLKRNCIIHFTSNNSNRKKLYYTLLIIIKLFE